MDGPAAVTVDGVSAVHGSSRGEDFLSVGSDLKNPLTLSMKLKTVFPIVVI